MSIFTGQQSKLEQQIAALETQKSKAVFNYSQWGTQANKSKIFAIQGKINKLVEQLNKMKEFQHLAR